MNNSRFNNNSCGCGRPNGFGRNATGCGCTDGRSGGCDTIRPVSDPGNTRQQEGCGCAMSREKLMEEIYKVSFAMDELRLFLDTHPDCSEALAAFEKYRKMRCELMRSYTDRFGPVYSYDVISNGGWCWNSEPLPWKEDF